MKSHIFFVQSTAAFVLSEVATKNMLAIDKTYLYQVSFSHTTCGMSLLSDRSHGILSPFARTFSEDIIFHPSNSFVGRLITHLFTRLALN